GDNYSPGSLSPRRVAGVQDLRRPGELAGGAAKKIRHLGGIHWFLCHSRKPRMRLEPLNLLLMPLLMGNYDPEQLGYRVISHNGMVDREFVGISRHPHQKQLFSFLQRARQVPSQLSENQAFARL